ncbi:hypothetical protein FRB99_002371 [Tulasnella sp. 403]|nr:hypothetical protein FRB99_002371 [Tulasnella sp. 403]
MNRIFGTTQKKPKTSLSDAIAATDNRVGTIEVKIKKLDAELARYRDQMAKMRNGPGKEAVQRRALGVLKQKRLYETQVQQLQQQSFNMESAAMTTDNLRNTMATLDAMKTANTEMRKQYGKIDVDKIQDLHYDMEDLIEQANEVQEALGRTYGVPEELDEDELQAGNATASFILSRAHSCPTEELDALDLEEEETPSYLQDLNATPDFIDEAPVEERKTTANPEAVKTAVSGS